MQLCLVAAGANLGDRQANLDAAVAALAAHPEIEVLAVSTYHETKAVGGPAGQGDFLNAAIKLQTTLSPVELLRSLLDIEAKLGRVREVHWGPRVIDLDLLLYGDAIIDESDLKVPHPWMHLRSFVLAPAAEIAGEMIHPGQQQSVSQLLAELEVDDRSHDTSL